MLCATITARNYVKAELGDKLRVIRNDGNETVEKPVPKDRSIIVKGPRGFLAYPDEGLYLEFDKYFEDKTKYGDYDMYIEEIKEENTYGVRLLWECDRD